MNQRRPIRTQRGDKRTNHIRGTDSLLQWLEQTPVADWVAASAWGYPITLSSHGVGLAIVVGIILMVDFRVLGFFKSMPLGATSRLLPYMWAGFLLNLISGVALFVADAERFTFSLPFQLKILFIVIGVVLVWFLDAKVVKPAAAAGGDAALPGYAKPLAILSIFLWWFSVILSGRLVAYIG
jgi:membrane-bound ClpP family serine protease